MDANELEKTLSCCPFCGDRAKVHQVEWRITCSNYNSCPSRPSVSSADLDLAIKKWETRAVTAPIDPETGEVQA